MNIEDQTSEIRELTSEEIQQVYGGSFINCRIEIGPGGVNFACDAIERNP